jgi:hypothetical protein
MRPAVAQEHQAVMRRVVTFPRRTIRLLSHSGTRRQENHQEQHRNSGTTTSIEELHGVIQLRKKMYAEIITTKSSNHKIGEMKESDSRF